MGHKHLHELLREDQEPFQLTNFIADRRRQLKSSTTATVAGKTALQLRKRKSIMESTSSSTVTRNFCINHVCLFSYHDSPDFRKSPFLDFPSTSPNKPPNNDAVLLHVPTRTAAILLDAATRVQKPKFGFGLFGSFLKRLKDRSTRTKTREIGPVIATASSPPTRRSRNDSRHSTADWSEKSSESETSCSSRSIHESEEIEFVGAGENCFCSSPSSPFRFSLQRSPSPSLRSPEFISPVASPIRHFQEKAEILKFEDDVCREIHREEEDEKEQCSPVSVLDPSFDDDVVEHDDGAVEEDGYDIECAYANVHRAKHQLLQKLRRFERLAELDPIELEKHMFDDDDGGDPEDMTNEDFATEIVDHLGVAKIPWYMKKLVSDLITEETKDEEHEVAVKRVCKRLHSWKVVESNTIDMMIEMDFKNGSWKRDDETIKETGIDIEMGIFGFLVEELAQELWLLPVQNDVVFDEFFR